MGGVWTYGLRGAVSKMTDLSKKQYGSKVCSGWWKQEGLSGLGLLQKLKCNAAEHNMSKHTLCVCLGKTEWCVSGCNGWCVAVWNKRGCKQENDRKVFDGSCRQEGLSSLGFFQQLKCTAAGHNMIEHTAGLSGV